MYYCHKCSAELEIDKRVAVSREAECPSCKADVKACLNCRFYDKGKSSQCAEPRAEYTANKERANFCSFFELKEGGKAKGDSAKRNAADLFKDGAAEKKKPGSLFKD